MLRDFNAGAFWAGITAFLWYVFGALPLQDAFEKAFGADLRFGALVAFAVAATPFSIAGITSAFWAVLAGLVAVGAR